MKKTFVIMACLAVATSSFAYYDSYSRYSSASSGPTLTEVFMLIVGILQIILFFKIWGMTNNIKALKKDHFNETSFDTLALKVKYLRNNLILGKKENVKNILLMNFINKVESDYKNNKQSIKPYVESLKKQFDKIGEELPTYMVLPKFGVIN